ncbi:hypothetical protein NJL88_26640 [Streptomyces sp. DK15]|uniref:hypothetical protein n=1 Tax=Streptomyces sp. DK15 TaxID=2957499 RepID=UPI0029ABEA0B|nr:hypothetical protein [Streptomyces sp. DK15]MDX2393572.1 hypothetical protein [Streptomyces sp. DK15]
MTSPPGAVAPAGPGEGDRRCDRSQAGHPATAHADNDSDFGGGVNAANNWNFTADAVCAREVAVVPVPGDGVGDHANNCSNGSGNVIDHFGR